MEFLYKQPLVTIDGILPNPETPKNKKKQKPRKRRNNYYQTFCDEKSSERRRTPLHHACIGHQLEAVKFFIRNGANVNIQDTDGDTPLLAVLKEAVRSKQKEKSLIRKGNRKLNNYVLNWSITYDTALRVKPKISTLIVFILLLHLLLKK